MDDSEKIHLNLLKQMNLTNKILCSVMQKAVSTAELEHEKKEKYRRVCLLAYQLLKEKNFHDTDVIDLCNILHDALTQNDKHLSVIK